MVTEVQVTWSSSNSTTLLANTSSTSDEFNITTKTARIELKADNQSPSPQTNDVIYIWLLETSGDPDGASTDEFTTTGHAELLAVLKTFEDNPAIESLELPLPHKGAKLYADGQSAGTSNIIHVSATITTD